MYDLFASPLKYKLSDSRESVCLSSIIRQRQRRLSKLLSDASHPLLNLGCPQGVPVGPQCLPMGSGPTSSNPPLISPARLVGSLGSLFFCFKNFTHAFSYEALPLLGLAAPTLGHSSHWLPPKAIPSVRAGGPLCVPSASTMTPFIRTHPGPQHCGFPVFLAGMTPSGWKDRCALPTTIPQGRISTKLVVRKPLGAQWPWGFIL